MTRKTLSGLFHAMRVNRGKGTTVTVRQRRVGGSFTYDVDNAYGVAGDRAKHRVIATLCPGTDYDKYRKVGAPALKWEALTGIVRCLGGAVVREEDGSFTYSI